MTLDIVRISPGSPPSGAPGLIWSAPGSIGAEAVERAWLRRLSVGELGVVGGPWAVLLWNPAAGEHILVADPVGVQPLYWARTADGRIAAASLLSAIVDLPEVDDELDYEGILLDQGWGFSGPAVLHRTRFAAVSRVPWGRALRIRGDGSTRLEQYWDPTSLPGPDESLSLADCAELLRERIDAAIRRQTPVDRPVGAHVSGGLDCTSVACRAHQILKGTGGGLVAGYSWAPSDMHVPRFEGDERDLLDDVARSENLRIRTVHPDESGDWFWQLDPNRYSDSTTGREVWTLPQARADGVEVMLTGWGGDECASFNGRGVIKELLRRGRIDTAWKDISRRHEIHDGRRPSRRVVVRDLASGALSGMPYALRGLHERARRRDRWTRSQRLDAAIRDYSTFAADVRVAEERAYGAARDHHEMQLYMLGMGYVQHRTGAWYQSGRVQGIEYRYPLLDLGVVEAALRLPYWAFRHEGWTRIGFRLAASPWVPASVTWNVAKYEPALYWPPARRPVIRSKPQATWATDDPKYMEVMRLVDTTWAPDGEAISRDARVVARPNMAPPFRSRF